MAPFHALLITATLASFAVGAISAQDEVPPTQAPQPGQYDATGIYPSTAFLTPPFLQSDTYQIDNTVYNDGIYNTWRVFSNGATYDVTGNERLMILLREISATASIMSESNAKRFAEAMKNAGEDQLKAAQNVLRNPGQTVRSIPQGASRFLGRVGNTVKHAAKGELDVDPDATPGDGAKKLIGVDAAKRQLAAEFGVNPYSKNAALQKALNDAAWAQSLGKVTMNLASNFVVPAGVGAALTGINVTDFLTSDQVNMKPEDLEKSNRRTLSKIGVPEETADALFNNPDYDPWTISAMINSISGIGLPAKQAEVFFTEAAAASTEVDAYFYFRMAQLMAAYNSKVSPITRLTPTNRVILCLDKEGKLVVPMWLDYLAWTPELEAAAERLQARAQSEAASGVVVLFTGDLTPLATSKLQGMGFQVMSRAFMTPQQ